MAEEIPQDGETPAPKKKSKLPMILGLVLFAAGGGGGFFAVQKGLILGGGDHAAADEHAAEAAVTPLPSVSYVPIDPMTINLGESAGNRYLRFQAQLEVEGAHNEEVTHILPRIVDVLNSYLRAVDVADIQDRSALVRLRAQMLRRIQLVAGAGRVRDLLITEFVLN